jgi:hypothetical protein
VNPSMVRDLVGTVSNQKAEMGLLILLSKATRGMSEVADQSGSFTNPMTGTHHAKIQICTISPVSPEQSSPLVFGGPHTLT